jgi:dTDP-4-amino-4,6-dideoxygalactose transaminase
LTNGGPFVEEFEARVAAEAGVRHCVAVCNATLGIEVLVRALSLTGEVILPAFTFVATAHAITCAGLTPVFCDVDPVTHNLDPDRVAELISPHTSAILAVHLWGRPCDVEALGIIADDHGLALIFDSSHAFACASDAGSVGTFGDAEVFSFHATKFLNAFEGGAIVTNDDTVAEGARLGRNFGFADYDTVASLGTNAKMSEMSAAMGLTSLEAMDRFIDRNRDNDDAYRSGLAGLPGVRLLDNREQLRSNFQYVVVEVDAQAAGISRDNLLEALRRQNVLARRYFYPGCHRMEPYRSDATVIRRLPATERLSMTVLALPTGTSVTPHDVGIVCDLISRRLQ